MREFSPCLVENFSRFQNKMDEFLVQSGSSPGRLRICQLELRCFLLSVTVSSSDWSFWTGYIATVVLEGLVWMFSLGFEGLVEDWFSKNRKPSTRKNEFFQNQSWASLSKQVSEPVPCFLVKIRLWKSYLNALWR